MRLGTQLSFVFEKFPMVPAILSPQNKILGDKLSFVCQKFLSSYKRARRTLRI